MTINWPTKETDVQIAEQILEQYAMQTQSTALVLFELVVNSQLKRMDYQLAGWVNMLAMHFKTLYGPEEGDQIIKRLISYWLTSGQTMH